MMSQEFEKEVFKIGSELLTESAKQDHLFFKKNWWYQKMLSWTMKRQSLKTNLFRFIDVLPNLTTDSAFLSHWNESFKEEDLRFITSGLGVIAPSLLVKTIRKQITQVAQMFITGSNMQESLKVISKNWERGLAFSLDILGEETLSEKEATAYFQAYLLAMDQLKLAQKDWSYKKTLQRDSDGELPSLNLSVKASALFSQVKVEAWDYSKEKIKNRLRPLFQKAVQDFFFINMDMEYYHHKDLYIEIFKELLMEEEFKDHPHFGIVVQAYLKESLEDLKGLIDFCKKRKQKITIRLVKGAYWDSEFLMSQQKNWSIPVYSQKEETDLNFEKALALLFKESKYVKIAIGSHNVRSIACALAHHKNHPSAQLEFQFLYGMAEGLSLALSKRGYLTRLYCTMGDLIPGMSYLVRRLLENSANQSFIFNSLMKKESPEKLLSAPAIPTPATPTPTSPTSASSTNLKEASKKELASFNEKSSLKEQASSSFFKRFSQKLRLKTTQNESNNFHLSYSDNSVNQTERSSKKAQFVNHPVPDFSKKENRELFQKSLRYWEKLFPIEVPLFIKPPNNSSLSVFLRENPNKKDQIISKTPFVNQEMALKAVEECHRFFPKWKAVSDSKRVDFLKKTAQLIEKQFFHFASLQVYEVGKTWEEACADVAEAIDFCSFYASSYEKLSTPKLTDEVAGEDSFLSYEPIGCVAVIAPWNFPLAILTGMLTAPLVCGNTVLIKPAEQSSLTAYELMKLLLTAGFPSESFAFLPGRGEEVGEALVKHPKVSVVSFTGSLEVGQRILKKINSFSAGSQNNVNMEKPKSINQSNVSMEKHESTNQSNVSMEKHESINQSLKDSEDLISFEKTQNFTKQKNFKRAILEMGGKNAIVIDSSADLDLAVKGVNESAFGFQGQKCSACSRVIVLEDVYEKFISRWIPALESLVVGATKNPESSLGALVDELSLKRVTSFLQKQKDSLLYSVSIEKEFKDKAYLFPPSIYLSSDPHSDLMQKELFAPIVACFKVKTLEQAIEVLNQTQFGLTAGLYSRHPGSIEFFKSQVEAGNVYINRNCTGAIVKRHPFGGRKMSGLGSKAGQADYLKQFLQAKVVTENQMRRGFSPELFK